MNDNGEPVVETPTTLKVGDKEYTPEEIEKLEKARDYFQTESQRVKEELKTLQNSDEANDLSKKGDDVISGDLSATELTSQQLEDLKYMEKLGFISTKKMNDIIAKVKEEAIEETNKELTKKELKAKIEKEILEESTNHDFIDAEEVKKYLSDRAEGKNGSKAILTVKEAILLLYHDKIEASKIKPDDLPGVEKSKKQGIDEEKPKVLKLGSREMSSYLADKLKKIS